MKDVIEIDVGGVPPPGRSGSIFHHTVPVADPPVTGSKGSSGMFNFIKTYQTLIAALVVAGGLIFYKVWTPSSDTAFNMRSSARAYATAIVNGYGESCLAAASDIRAGKSFPDAQTGLRDGWKSKCSAAFTKEFGYHLNMLCPEGQDPTPAQRESIAQFLDSLGKEVQR